ncbi:MAG: hypothetical protein SO160_13175 [Lachnospiraceae bacterium]|nr:hypothetical protein [Lachnospiraceae bacterium]
MKKENIPYDEVNPFEETIDNVEEYDPDQESVLITRLLLQKRWRNAFFQCFGEEKMFMPSVEKAEVIFRNAITDGMTGFARNNEMKSCFVMSVKIQNGQNWMLRK